MKLIEVTQKLHQLDLDKTIYAKKPWVAESEAILAIQPNNQTAPEMLKKEGYEYFLEVFVAKDVLPDLSHVTPSFTLEQWCERLIDYAENDA